MFDRLVIGLGNPGPTYEGTRHNVGFDVVRILLDRHGGSWCARGNCRLAILDEKMQTAQEGSEGAHAEGLRVAVAEPTTFMNRSGLAVRALVEEFELEPAQLLIVYDEVALPLGSLRLRSKGSPGGHRGMESVVYNLRTSEVARLRCGVGPCPEDRDLSDFVLERFAPQEQSEREALVRRSAECVVSWAVHGVARTMNQFNGPPPREGDDSTPSPEKVPEPEAQSEAPT